MHVTKASRDQLRSCFSFFELVKFSVKGYRLNPSLFFDCGIGENDHRKVDLNEPCNRLRIIFLTTVTGVENQSRSHHHSWVELMTSA